MKSRTNKNIDVITHTCARARAVYTHLLVWRRTTRRRKDQLLELSSCWEEGVRATDEASGSDHPPVRWAFHPAVNQTSLWRMRAALT